MRGQRHFGKAGDCPHRPEQEIRRRNNQSRGRPGQQRDGARPNCQGGNLVVQGSLRSTHQNRQQHAYRNAEQTSPEAIDCRCNPEDDPGNQKQ